MFGYIYCVKYGFKEIYIFTKDGKKTVFKLEGNETEIFRINLDEYKILGGRVSQNGGGNGVIEDIILTDENNNKIKLDKNNFFGVELNEK